MSQSPYEKPSLEVALARLARQERKIAGLEAKLLRRSRIERRLDKMRMAVNKLIKAIDSGDPAKIGRAYDIATNILSQDASD